MTIPDKCVVGLQPPNIAGLPKCSYIPLFSSYEIIVRSYIVRVDAFFKQKTPVYIFLCRVPCLI